MELAPWVLRKAGLPDWKSARNAHLAGHAKIKTVATDLVKQWMKDKGWRRSWLFPDESFHRKLFDHQENYQMALADGMVEILIPLEIYQVPPQYIEEIDQLYNEKAWDAAVIGLREIRRAIDAGVVIEIASQKFSTSGSFYKWAHQRYHLLEEAADLWILMD